MANSRCCFVAALLAHVADACRGSIVGNAELPARSGDKDAHAPPRLGLPLAPGERETPAYHNSKPTDGIPWVFARRPVPRNAIRGFEFLFSPRVLLDPRGRWR